MAPLIEIPDELKPEESPKFDERDRELLKTDIKQFLSKGLVLRFERKFNFIKKKEILILVQKKLVEMSLQVYRDYRVSEVNRIKRMVEKFK